MDRDVRRQSADIGYWLGEPFWGRGFATQALRLTSDYAFANFNIVRLRAFVFDWNPASARAEKASYKLEGRMRPSMWKDGKFTDELIYARLRGE